MSQVWPAPGSGGGTQDWPGGGSGGGTVDYQPPTGVTEFPSYPQPTPQALSPTSHSRKTGAKSVKHKKAKVPKVWHAPAHPSRRKDLPPGVEDQTF